MTPGSGVAADFTDAVRYQVINEKANDSKTYFAVVTTNSTGGGGTTPGTGKETNPNFKPFDMVPLSSLAKWLWMCLEKDRSAGVSPC